MSDNRNTVANRELSVNKAHEFWLKFQQAGGNLGMIDKVNESPGNTIAKEIVYAIKGFEAPKLAEAQQIMGNNHFFGPNQWYDFMGWKVKAPPIPWLRRDLETLSKTHFLFLGINCDFNGKLLSAKRWIELLRVMEFPLETSDGGIYIHKFFEEWTCRPNWYLMYIGPFPGSQNLYTEDQVELLGDRYEAPSLIERHMANVLYYKLNGTCLDDTTWVRVNPMLSGSKDTIAIQYDGSKLYIGTDPGYSKVLNVGIAASMKLPH